jgi:Tfp pilus assembly protein PilX
MGMKTKNNGLVSAKAKMGPQRIKKRRAVAGSVLLVIIFAIALMTMITVGILQMTTEELMLMQNQLYAAQAIEVAEAGLNDAFAQIRTNSSWTPDASYTHKSFTGYGSYTVTLTGTLPTRTITSEGTSSQGYLARLAANVTVGTGSPHVIRIDSLRINE